jgi:hypothetical protein
MDPNYRAADEYWRLIENWPGLGEYPGNSCLLELRARIEALEEGSTEQAESNRFCFDAIVARIEALEAAQQPQQSVPPAEIFPVEYADSDGDGIRILMEPADATGRVCWVVRNSRHVNPCHEFSSPEDAYAAHRRAQPAPAPPAPADGLVETVGSQIPLLPDGRIDDAIARTVIYVIAAWLRSEPWIGRAAADRLEQEASQ